MDNISYISGIYALNLSCNLLTCGDWHKETLNWNSPLIYNSKDMLFKEWGIELDKDIPTANHIRALLDMLEMQDFGLAQGMNNDFICNDEYDDLVFSKVIEMRKLPHWGKIDRFMEREYLLKWASYKNNGIIIPREVRVENRIRKDLNAEEANKLSFSHFNRVKYELQYLYDIVCIYKYYSDILNDIAIHAFRDVLGYLGDEYLEYIFKTQTTSDINIYDLQKDLSEVYKEWGLAIKVPLFPAADT